MGNKRPTYYEQKHHTYDKKALGRSHMVTTHKEKVPCKYCAVDLGMVSNEEYRKACCMEINDRTGKGHYICTRKKGHTGRHVACSSEYHEIYGWVGTLPTK